MTHKRPPQPDLQEVLSRARALNPDAVDPSWDAEAVREENHEGAAANVVRLAPPDEGMDAALASFVSSANRHLDAKIHARALQSIPQAPPMRARRRWHGLAAVAAVLALSVGGYAWFSASGGQAEAQRASQAKFVSEQNSPNLLSQPGRSGAKPPQSMQTSAGEASAAPPTEQSQEKRELEELAPATGQLGEPSTPEVHGEDQAPAAELDTAAPVKSRPKASAPRASLNELDDAAQRAWRAGDLAEAQRLFRRITKRAPRSKRAELAYADLFSLAEQRGDRAQLARLWSAYLERFPSGRYADDTRARLCRRKTKAPQTQCWSEYLRKHPRGAHVQEARSRVDSAPTQ